MCFSLEADVVAGLAVGAIGVDAMRHTRRPAEIPLAALPLVLAGHQLVEALVWSGLEGGAPDSVWRPALWLYLIIAFGALPVLVPIAVRALEPEAGRQRLSVFIVIGLVVAAVLVHAVLRGPIDAHIEGHHIAYSVELGHGGWFVALYAFASAGSLLFSSHHYLRWYGAANLVAAGLLAWLNNSGLISLWCLWAALVSLTVALHLRHTGDTQRRPLPSLAVSASTEDERSTTKQLIRSPARRRSHRRATARSAAPPSSGWAVGSLMKVLISEATCSGCSQPHMCDAPGKIASCAFGSASYIEVAWESGKRSSSPATTRVGVVIALRSSTVKVGCVRPRSSPFSATTFQ